MLVQRRGYLIKRIQLDGISSVSAPVVHKANNGTQAALKTLSTYIHKCLLWMDTNKSHNTPFRLSHSRLPFLIPLCSQ